MNKKILIICTAMFLAAILLFAYWYGTRQQEMVLSYIFSPATIPSNEKVVCLCFDDGWKTQLDAVKILQKYGFNATFAIITSYVEGEFPAYLTWQQIGNLSLSNDIESHSYSHIYLNKLSNDSLIQELSKSKDQLKNHGIDSEIFIYPYGLGYNNQTIRNYVSQYYLSARCLNDTTFDIQHGDRYAATTYSILNSTTIDKFTSYVNTSSSNHVVILCYHRFDFGNISTSTTLVQFDNQMLYLKTNGYKIVTLRDLLLKRSSK